MFGWHLFFLRFYLNERSRFILLQERVVMFLFVGVVSCDMGDVRLLEVALRDVVSVANLRTLMVAKLRVYVGCFS